MGFYEKFIEGKTPREIASEAFGGSLVVASVAGLVYWGVTHETPPKDHCVELRKVFADKVDAQDIEGALDAPARIVVVDTPDAEDGLPCDISLEPVR